MNQDKIQEYCVNSFSRYWKNNRELISGLPISSVVPEDVELPVKLVSVKLPVWAKKYTISGCFLVPSEAAANKWEDVNWWYVMYWYLHCLAERKFESIYGPIHSYSYRLKGWDNRMWKHAWVNRIAMFLRLWVCKNEGKVPEILFPEKLEAEILLTHDLDAVSKTLVIRLKQCTFNVYNAIKLLGDRRLRDAVCKLKSAFQFLLGTGGYWNFDKLGYDTDNSIIKKRIINVYGGGGGAFRSLKKIVVDPGYGLHNEKLVGELNTLCNNGFVIGLHQSYDAWDDSSKMMKEKITLEGYLGVRVLTCRQHWLKFSFLKTWVSQAKSGFVEDTTLGFNDRVGFRNGAALRFSPIDMTGKFIGLESVPMILMDSHLYDYNNLNSLEIDAEIDALISEVELIKGQASIIWHPHTLGSDYGWSDGFQALLERLGCIRKYTEEIEVDHDL